MLGLYAEGLVLGVVCALFVGPVLFTLLDAAVQGGFFHGFRVALGIAVSDVVALALLSLGLQPVLQHSAGQTALGVVGAIILVLFGVSLAVSTRRAPNRPAPTPIRFPFWAGFFVNFVNPFVFTFWIGTIANIGTRYGWTPPILVPTLGGMVTTIFVTDVAKAAVASRLSPHLSGRGLTRLRFGAGMLLIAGGVALLLRTLTTPSEAG